jgi:hypothetical protein
MTIAVSRVWTDKNQIVYLLDSDGSPASSTASITASGAVTPDLVTDGANTASGEAIGPAMRRVVRAGLDGLGLIAAGGFTQALARSLLTLDDAAAALGGVLAPRARTSLIKRTGATANWLIDANVDGSSRPQIDIAVATAAGTAYLYVQLNHSLAT